MGRKLRSAQIGVFPGYPSSADRYVERRRVLDRELAKRAGLPHPERKPFENLGNRDLPVFNHKAEAQAAVRDHQISIIEGPTGSGKSTQIGQYALEMGYKKIIYLEPRTMLADNLAARLQSELSDQLGAQAENIVGVRHSERYENPDATFQVMTPGTFMRISDDFDRLGDEPVFIVGDEIHEKDFESELAVAAAVQKLAEHKKWRLMLASATVDAASIRNAYQGMTSQEIPLVSVEGRPHELDIIDEPAMNPVSAYNAYGQEHEKTLIFTSGKVEIRDTIEELRKQPGMENVLILPLHAKLPRSEVLKATNATLRPGQRQIIVATSAAQSGITIPGLTLVITDGTIRRPELNADGTPGLYKELCSQDELTQQGGRAGRDVPGGVVVRVQPSDELFDYVAFEDRAQQAPAQIYHTNISRNVLLTSALDADFFKLNDYLIHKVDRRTILEAYEVLYRLQAIDELNKITYIGKKMNRFPLRPELSRAIVEAEEKETKPEIMRMLIAITSAIEAGGFPYYEKDVGEKWRDDVRPESTDDYLAQLDMFMASRELYIDGSVDEEELVRRNYDPKNTYRAHKTYGKVCRALGIESERDSIRGPTPQEVDQLHDFLLAGLFDSAHVKKRVEKKRGGADRIWYESALSDASSDRYVSQRSMYKGREEYVIGMARGFEKRDGEELVRHEVIENVFPTSLAKLTRHVLHVTERTPVTSSRVVGGRLLRFDQQHFGSIVLGEVPSQSRLIHTDATRESLSAAAFDKPTQSITELVGIKRRIEYLLRRTPADELATYFPNGTLRDEWLKDEIVKAIGDDVEDIFAMDNRLRSMIVRKQISLQTWISEEKEKELIARSPEDITIGDGLTYRINWSRGKASINGFNLHYVDQLPRKGLFLPDGREVLFRFNDGQSTKRLTAAQIIASVAR